MLSLSMACLLFFLSLAPPFTVETPADSSFDSDRSTPPILTDDSAFVSDAKAAVDSLYNLRYQEARELFAPWIQRHPDHPLWKFWDGMVTWWHILPDLQNRSMDDTLFSQLQQSSRTAQRVLDNDPSHRDALLIHALSKGLMARQYANREKWFTSINQARHAINALRSLNDLEVTIPDLLLGEGLLDYYSAYLPEAYPFIRTVSWMLPRGDKQQGLELMQQAADSSIYMRPEALYFLGKIYMNHEHNSYKALPYFKQLYREYPRNAYYSRQYIRALVRANREDEAVRRIDQILKRDDTPYEAVVREELLAWRGYLKFQRRQLDEAEQNLRDSYILATNRNLPREVNRPFHIMSGYYLGRIYELKGDTTIALNYYRSVTDADPETHYSKRAADRYDELK